MRSIFLCTIAALVGGALVVSAVSAGELPKTHVKASGNNSNTIISIYDEVPFWNKTIPTASNGQVTAHFTPSDVLGIKGFDILRLLKLGVLDFASHDISKMAGDHPVFEGCDLAGLTLDLDTARKACEAWKPAMARVMKEKFNTKLLALASSPPQVFWCRTKISGLGDLKGKKVRVFNKTMTDFVKAAGGTAVSIGYADVVPALQRGVVDCAVTGSGSGNIAGWWEVAEYLYPLSLGWSISFQGANVKSWNKLAPDVQQFFLEQFKEFEGKLWATNAKSIADAENCNFNKEPCVMGKKADMKLVPVRDADKATHKRVLEDVVLVEWAKRAGKNFAKEWNETVGKIVNLQIPLDKL